MINKIITTALLALYFSQSFAGNATNTTKATAQLAAVCQVNIANISFGDIQPGQPSSSTSGTLNILCTKNTVYNFNLRFVSDYGGCPNLKGASHGDVIYYNIFYNSSPINSGTLFPGVGTGAFTAYNLNAMIQPPAATWGANGCKTYTKFYTGFNPYPIPDNYSDTVTAAIVF